MYQFEVTVVQQDELRNEMVNRLALTVEVDGDPKSEEESPHFIQKRNREAVKAAIIQYLDLVAVYEGDSLYIQNVKRNF